MAISRGNEGTINGGFNQIRVILEMIKFEHSIFALPFAMISLILAAKNMPHDIPPGRVIFWVIVAMVAARSAAMAFNRIVDASYDAGNPRTSNRAIPAGLLSVGQVAIFTIVSSLLFILAAWRINMICFLLSPLALVALLGYSYTKRFTSLSHFALGFAIGLAPLGAWIAVMGTISIPSLLLGATVMLWIGGFDIIYALQDVDFDTTCGLHSLPCKLGKGVALNLSRLMHAVMLLLLVWIGYLCGLHFVYYLGVLTVGALIYYEHSLVSPTDISKLNLAFFTLNGWISVSLFAFVILDRLFRH